MDIKQKYEDISGTRFLLILICCVLNTLFCFKTSWGTIYRGPIYRGPIYSGPIHRSPTYRGPIYRGSLYRDPIYRPPIGDGVSKKPEREY